MKYTRLESIGFMEKSISFSHLIIQQNVVACSIAAMDVATTAIAAIHAAQIALYYKLFY